MNQSIFDTMQSKDIVSWTAMIVGYTQNGKGIEALKLFEQMQQERIQPDHMTYYYSFNMCRFSSTFSWKRNTYSN
jgi:pentatricopeptide repeat protein